MATRQQFVDAIVEIWRNHGIYVGTGNGELTLDVAGKFFAMEKAYGRRDQNGNPLWHSDTARDYEFLAKCYRNHLDMTKSRTCDCSGLEVAALRDLGVIKPTADYNCRTFQERCTEVPLKDLQPADLVFDKKMVYDEKKEKWVSNAGHMGTYIGDGYVIESRGRDYGIVKRKVSEGNWAIGGRLNWFDDDIPVLTRNLRYIADNLMHGEDVKQAQERLNKKGCKAGVEDGIFGLRTYDATIEFQTIHSDELEVDGVIGPATWNKLWEGR